MAITKVPLDKFEQMRPGLKDMSQSDIDAVVGGVTEEVDTDTAACLGCAYNIGDLSFDPVPMGVFPLLQMIDSPFVSEGLVDDLAAGNIDMIHIISALYVCVHGADAVAPIAAVQRKQRTLVQLEEMAKGRPEYFEKLIEARLKLDDELAAFEAQAMAFWESIEGATVTDAAEVIAQVITDAMKPYGLMPESEENKGPVKKNSTQGG